MYANLKLVQADAEPIMAYEIKVLPHGVIEVQLDGQDSTGRDPIPKGTIYLDGDIGPWTISASF